MASIRTDRLYDRNQLFQQVVMMMEVEVSIVTPRLLEHIQSAFGRE